MNKDVYLPCEKLWRTSITVADEAAAAAAVRDKDEAAVPDKVEKEMEDEVLFCYCFTLSSYRPNN